MATSRLARVLWLLALAPVFGCHCNSQLLVSQACANQAHVQPTHLAACVDGGDCGDHYTCTNATATLKCCTFADRGCSTDADCCPGQQCNPNARKCFDKFLDCAQGGNAACGNPDGGGDLVCQSWTDAYETTYRCVYAPCDAQGNCPAGRSCFRGQCLSSLPCGGACPAGAACVPEAGNGGWCQKFACPASCAPGFIATFSDTIHIWDTCNLRTESCLCQELPPLHSNDLGRFSSLAADALHANVLVSQYDGQYGDLVVNRYSDTGLLLSQDYVDGVPANGTVTYGPSGPRGGITDPGPDVGRFSSAAVQDPYAYVSYYDVTNGALRFAVRQPDGKTWKTFQVDGTTGDVGLYTSLAIDSAGLPAIAYFQRAGKAGFDASVCPGGIPPGPAALITALKFARATKPNPQSAADFHIVVAACQALPAPVCYGCTGTCADTGSGPTCYPVASGCASCSATQACVLSGGNPTCGTVYNPSVLLHPPDGVGVFSSLAFGGKKAFIAYQLRSSGTGRLYGLALDATDVPAAPVLLDGTDDTGYFPSLKTNPAGGLVLSYQDWTTRSLKFYAAPDLRTGVTPEVIDTGAPDAGVVAYVGGSSALAYSPSGDLYAAYEDATHNDVLLAVRKPTWRPLPPLHTSGAVGFFTSGAFLGGKLYVSSAQLHARVLLGAPTLDNSLVLDNYAP